MSNIVTQELGIPGLTGKLDSANAFDGYTIKYAKADLDEPVDIMFIQDIETRGLRGDEIVVLNKDKFTFNEKYFIVLQYLEKSI